jgi:hypothetical protein
LQRELHLLEETMEFRDDDTSFLRGLAAGLGLGALAMFILDPQQGRRRRALVRDKMVRYGREVSDLAAGTSKDLRNRAQGVVAETRGMVREAVASNEGEAKTVPF